MKKRNKALLVLLALVLISALGAKMYSTITMGDDEWIGLGANAGRIVFDDATVDEVNVMNAVVGVNTSTPGAYLHNVPGMAIYGPSYAGISLANDGTSDKDWMIWTYNDDLSFYESGTSHSAGSDRVTFKAGGRVGIGDTTPSYDLDVAGDIRATEEIHSDLLVSSGGSVFATEDVFAYRDVIANDDVIAADDVIASGKVDALEDVIAGESVFIGRAEDPNEDGAHMLTRADNSDGGYLFYARRNLTVATVLGGTGATVGPVDILWVQWLVHDNEADIYTEGDGLIERGGNQVLSNDGDGNILRLYYEGGEGTTPVLTLLRTGSHYYDVSLLMLWIED